MVVLQLSSLAEEGCTDDSTSRCWRLPLLVAACTGFALLLFPDAGVAPLRARGEMPYEVAAVKNVMLRMRDGTRLATDIYRPARNGAPIEGRFPALLERTPYNKERGVAGVVGYFVPRGYVVIVQDVRGRYQSEGRWRPIMDDPNDGFDTAVWIGAQTWSDGGIGTMGTSYGGATQHAIAIGNAPHVKAMVPRNAIIPGYRCPLPRSWRASRSPI